MKHTHKLRAAALQNVNLRPSTKVRVDSHKSRKNLILPPQIPGLIKKLKQADHTPTPQHKKIIQAFLSNQIDSPLFVIPEYEYEEVGRGLFCKSCKVKMKKKANRVICPVCHCKYSFEKVLLDLIEEISILFPTMKITNEVIFEWTEKAISKSTIRRVLGKNFTLKARGHASYYEWNSSK